MLPKFPKLKLLELSDKDDVESLTVSFPPYSDFNFVSLWSWNIHNSAMVGQLNGNLIVLFQDYITNEKFLTFIGEKALENTIDTLLTSSQLFDTMPELRLVPEHSILALPPNKYFIHEDPSNHDYVSSVEELSVMKGSKFMSKRNHVHKFSREYGTKTIFKHLPLQDLGIQKEIKALFKKWQKVTEKSDSETVNEFHAVERLLNGSASFNLHAIGLYLDTEMIAFLIHEKVQQEYVVFHFEKADSSFVGIFEYCKQHVSGLLLDLGCKYMNLEQDLGLEGLQNAKLSYRPVHFLKKYIIRLRD